MNDMQTNQGTDLLAELRETRSFLRGRREALARTSSESGVWAAILNGWCVEIDAFIEQDAKQPDRTTIHDDFLNDPQASVAQTTTGTH